MSITAMKQALDALTEHGAPYLRHGVDWDNAITALRAAISEQEKCEPAGLFYSNGKSIWYQAHPPYQSGAVPLYTAPQDVDMLLEKIDVLQQNLEMTRAAYISNTHPALVQEQCEPVAKVVFDTRIEQGVLVSKTRPQIFRTEFDLMRLEPDTFLYTHSAPVPAGWQLVPVEPTDAMIRASMDLASVVTYSNGQHTHIPIAYKAMLAAAPKPGENHE